MNAIVRYYILGAPTTFGGYQNTDMIDICASITKSPSIHYLHGSGSDACNAIIENMINAYAIFMIYAICLILIILMIYLIIVKVQSKESRYLDKSNVFILNNLKLKKKPRCKLRQMNYLLSQ